MRLVAAVVYACWWIAAAIAQPAPHFLIIGVDGLSVEAVSRANAPRLHGLMARSAWTLEARGVLPTLSSPNWASMISGAGPEQHGVTSNGYLKKLVEIEPVCRDAEGRFPTMFEVLRAQRPASRIAIFHEWPGFADLLEKDVPDVLQRENRADRTALAAMHYWEQNRPDLMFVHLDLVDHAGHEFGWLSSAYLQGVEEADAYIGELLDAVQRSGTGDSTYVLVTSDHGGKGRTHGKNSLAEIEIPWIFAGPGVVAGRIAAPVYTFDTAATVAWVFGLNAPGCWIGRPVLAAFGSSSALTLAHGAAAPARECPTEQHAPTVTPSAGGGFGADMPAHHEPRD
jgi:hypothetical protein